MGLYINRRWCNNYSVCAQICSPDTELLSVWLRPFYLPRDFPRVYVTLYGSIKGAYKSIAGSAIGSSDHNTVHLHPVYKSVLRRTKVCKRQVKVWNEDSSLALQGCFDCTDWSVCSESSDNIDELTDVVCSYISFCEDTVIPIKMVKVFPNNKPWSSSALKTLILKRKHCL